MIGSNIGRVQQRHELDCGSQQQAWPARRRTPTLRSDALEQKGCLDDCFGAVVRVDIVGQAAGQSLSFRSTTEHIYEWNVTMNPQSHAILFGLFLVVNR
jgi:hypothetical protein